MKNQIGLENMVVMQEEANVLRIGESGTYLRRINKKTFTVSKLLADAKFYAPESPELDRDLDFLEQAGYKAQIEIVRLVS